MMYLFLLLYPISVLVYVLFALAATAAVSVSVVWPAIDALLFAPEDGSEEGGRCAAEGRCPYHETESYPGH